MRAASASTLTSPSAADAVPPVSTIVLTRLSTPVQPGSMSPCTLCSLATPAGDTSDTTTVTPAAASARAVELPMPTGLPQPVISATRASLAMGVLPVNLVGAVAWIIPPIRTARGDRDHGHDRKARTPRAWARRIVGIGDRPWLHVVVRHLWRGR